MICRRCMRVPGRRRPAALLLHDRRGQPVHLPGRQGLRLLLPGPSITWILTPRCQLTRLNHTRAHSCDVNSAGEMHRPRLLLVEPGDRRPHRRVPQRAVPGRTRPLRSERDGVRRHGEARPGRPAPQRRTSPNPVHTVSWLHAFSREFFMQTAHGKLAACPDARKRAASAHQHAHGMPLSWPTD